MNSRIKQQRVRWQGIVKIQRPIATSGSMTECLVYNEQRTIMVQLELGAKTMADTFKKDELKVYYTATLNYGGTIALLERAEEQPW